MVSVAPDDGLDDRYLVQPVLKAMQVLQLVCEAPEPLSLNQLVRDAALPKTTVFRYLRTLATLGFVEHDAEADRYRPGIGLWRLSHASSPYETLRQVCKPQMKQLRQRFNETINLGVLSGGEVFYLDVLESERSLRMQSSVGASDPLHSTALGKVFLAFRPAHQRATLIPQTLARHTHNTITDRGTLLEQLEIIRTTGYAIEIGENEEGSLLHRRADPRPPRRRDRGDEPVRADLPLRREQAPGDLRGPDHRLQRDRPHAPRRDDRAEHDGHQSRRLNPTRESRSAIPLDDAGRCVEQIFRVMNR